jgi:cytosine/adenosine deaminase-related metal-dependent hydrolase
MTASAQGTHPGLLIRGGYVLTMDDAVGDLPAGDVHVRDGARTLGLADVTGSFTPGKRADLIVVSAASPSLGVLTDPARLLVTAATPRDVTLVIADGRVLKRGTALTTVDLPGITSAARTALSALLARAAR